MKLLYRDLKKDKKLTGEDINTILCTQEIVTSYCKIMNMSELDKKLATPMNSKKKKNWTKDSWLYNDTDERIKREFGTGIFFRALECLDNGITTERLADLKEKIEQN